MENKQHSPAYQAILKAGPRLKPLQQVHAHLIVSGYCRRRSLLTKLLSLACDAGFINYAKRIFFCIPNPDSFLFNTLIIRNSKSNLYIDSLLFYRRMILSNISPTNYTFAAVIKSCAHLSGLNLGRAIHAHILVSGYDSDLHIQAALISHYAKSSDLNVARKVFDKMPEKSVVAWNSMISGYEQNGYAKVAIGLFNLMRYLGVNPDSTTCVGVLAACAQLGDIALGRWVHEYIISQVFDMNAVLATSLINMYARCGNVSKAREVFDRMREFNVVAWTAMISGYGMHGYGSQAMELFHRMIASGARPNNVTFVAVLSACAHAGLVQEGRQVFASMRQEYGLVPGVEHHVCMVDLFGRAGLLNEAYKFINDVIDEKPSPAIWAAILGACKMHKNLDLGVKVAEHL